MTRGEKMWLAVATSLVLLAVSAPYFAGWLSAPPGQTFSGILVARQDGFSYLAKMRLGAGGDWLYQDMYAVQPHPKTPLFSLFILLGHLAAPEGDAAVPMATLAILYAISRVVCGAIFLVTLYGFIAVFVEPVTQRRLAWILIAIGGGLGWLLILLTGDALPLGAPPLDLYLGEANTIVPLLAYPHTLLARAALLSGILCLLRADDRGDWRWAAAAAGCWLLATLGVPFDILIAGGLMGGWIAARWLITRRIPWRLALMALVAGIPGALINIITLAIIGGDPVYAAWTAQNLLPLPPVLHLMSAFGVPAALAIIGAVTLRRGQHPRTDLLVGWAVVAPLLMLIPLPFQLRFIEGFAIPLGILAVVGLMHIAAGWQRNTAIAGLLVLLLPTSLLLVAGGAASALGGFGRFNTDQAAMLEWLRSRAQQGSVVMSSDDTGVMIPAAAPLRAVLGHGFETPDFDQTQAYVAQLYSGRVAPADALDWMRENRVRYVIFGPDEALLGNTTESAARSLLADKLGLTEVFAQGSYHIYEIGLP